MNMNSNKGFSLIEAMMGVMILGFVMVGILGTFSHQKVISQKTSAKNSAVVLAEMKLEELMKYSSTQLAGEAAKTQPVMDYIVSNKGTFEFFADGAQPDDPGLFKRSVFVELDIMGQLASLRVMVEYGVPGDDGFPFNVVLMTARGL